MTAVTKFPGYTFDKFKLSEKSSYRGVDPSEGGRVFAKPGIYREVGVLDVASMHPTSLINLNAFGSEFTPRFKDLLDARIAIKRKHYDQASTMLDGKLAPYLNSTDDAVALSYALKIVINIVYGMTSATFPNQFRDNRNIDNIVAKRGALFMVDLQLACQEKGWEVVHIKTDSIKLANITQEMIDFVMQFGADYGYEFEHEVTYDKFCLVNDAVYIARKEGKPVQKTLESWETVDPTDGKTPGRSNWEWDATGAQFQHPYVFKKLFSDEKITFDDMCETKQVQAGLMYLDYKQRETPPEDFDGLTFIGKTGRFTPVRPEANGGLLWRIKDDKRAAVTGTKGYLWMESELARGLDPDKIDSVFFEDLCDDAIKNIERFGSFKEFVS